jgi:RecB family endonuclease NucS
MALMPRSINEARISHDRLLVEVQQVLEREGWTVSPEPRLAGLRPDIVARDPYGNNYVIEIKAGAGRAHLGGVAQVEMYRNSLKSRLGDAKGVLILGGDVPEQLAAVAERAGVKLIDASADGDDSPGSLASSLTSLAQAPRR